VHALLHPPHALDGSDLSKDVMKHLFTGIKRQVANEDGIGRLASGMGLHLNDSVLFKAT